MSDPKVTVIGYIVLLLTLIAKWVREEIASRRNARQAVQRDQAVAEVKTELKDNTSTTEKIHKQLNGERSILLHTIAAQARRIAELTKKKDDVALADAAERVARDHDMGQLESK